MALGIRVENVQMALAPMLGAQFVGRSPLCDHAAEVLRAFDARRMDFSTLLERLKESIFGDLRRQCGPDMVFQHECGVRLKLRLRDIDTLADACLGVLLENLRLPLAELRQYAMHTQSLNAMRVLLAQHGHALAPMEREMWARIIRENYAPDQYQSWLK